MTSQHRFLSLLFFSFSFSISFLSPLIFLKATAYSLNDKASSTRAITSLTKNPQFKRRNMISNFIPVYKTHSNGQSREFNLQAKSSKFYGQSSSNVKLFSAAVSEDVGIISSTSSSSSVDENESKDSNLNSNTMDEDTVVNTFVRCSRCSAAYSVSEAMLGPEGSRVKCEVCGHSWYQATNRLQLLAEGFALKPYPEEMMEKVKDNVLNNRHPMDNQNSGKRAEISIFVGNLPFSVDEERLENLFVNYGEISNVTIVKDSQNKSRGYGFIEMAKKDAGEKAIQELDQVMIDGRNINVKLGGGKFGNNNGNRRR